MINCFSPLTYLSPWVFIWVTAHVFLWCLPRAHLYLCVAAAGACLVSVLYIPGCKCVHVRMFVFKWGRAAGVVLQVWLSPRFPRSCFESVEWNDHVICTHTALRAAVISPAVFSFPPAKERVEMCVWVNVWERIICVRVCVRACVRRERERFISILLRSPAGRANWLPHFTCLSLLRSAAKTPALSALPSPP